MYHSAWYLPVIRQNPDSVRATLEELLMVMSRFEENMFQPFYGIFTSVVDKIRLKNSKLGCKII